MRFVPKLLLSVAIAGASLAASAASYSSLVVFGDSLSDPGNALFLTKDIPFPGAGTLFLTSQGQNVDPQGHFSNGPTAAEYVASAFGLTTKLGWDPASVGGVGIALNYAVGGALTGSDHLSAGQVPVLASTGVTSQVAKYTNAPGFIAGSTLFMVQGGGNDIFQAQSYAAANGLSPAASQALYGAVINSATSNIANSIFALGLKGATNILWETLPDLGLTPMSQAGGPLAMGAASYLTASFNAVLAQKIALVDASLDAIRGFDVNIFGFDTAAFMQANFPNTGSLDMTAQPCLLAGDLPACSGRFFFDTVHPTTAAHQLFANQLIAAAVPEPEVWMLMLVGVGVVGLRARRKA